MGAMDTLLQFVPMATTVITPMPARRMDTTDLRGLAAVSSLVPARGSEVVMAMDIGASTATVADTTAIAVDTATEAVMAMAADTTEATLVVITAPQCGAALRVVAITALL